MKDSGQSIIEVILAAALFVMISAGTITIVISGFNSNRLGTEETIANQYDSEGIEAVRSIKNQAFANLINSTGTGLTRNVSNVWAFSGSNNIFDKYTRVITISDVQRDISGNIVASGGTVDPKTKKVTSAVTWNFTSTRPETTTLTTYFTNWKASFGKGGMLVYGDGGTTTDAVKYQILDASAGTWSVAASVADVDSTTTNKALRASRIYAASTRNEKVLITKHWDNSSQTIYAQVYNGTTWGNVVQLSQVFSSSFLDVRDFDGTYLNNGDFMAVYYDNSSTPKFRIWNGSSWSSQVSTQSIGGSPNYIIAKARPGTSEVMVAVFDQSNRASTEYFNGGTYIPGNWGSVTLHSSTASDNQRKYIDYTWDTNNTLKGALIFSDVSNNAAIDAKIWTATGSGGGAWSAGAQLSSSNNIGVMGISSRPGADEFLACDQDTTTTIGCGKISITPSWIIPTNPTLTSTSPTGIQKSFDVAYGANTGSTGIVVYSDATTIPKLKKYTSTTSTFDDTATNLSTLGGILKTVTIAPMPNSDDRMILMADANQDLYTVDWNGTNNLVYSTPAGKAFTTHGTNGSAFTEYWYDFTWDNF